jgi:hypothetical protein
MGRPKTLVGFGIGAEKNSPNWEIARIRARICERVSAAIRLPRQRRGQSLIRAVRSRGVSIGF